MNSSSYSNNNYKVSFQELKGKVGIDDVAYSLGYRVDKRAGIGRYFEMVLSDGISKRDTLIIRNTSNKAAQVFFRRDGSRGDVITLIKENLNSFNVDGKTEWNKVTNVLSKFANMPEQDYRSDLQYINSNRGSQPFNPDRYETVDINPSKISPLFKSRGLLDSTVIKFAPFLKMVCDRENKNFTAFNIGFPYTSSCHESVVGYELRGWGGFKSKAAGTNSNSAAWIADFSKGNGQMVDNVFFFESGFDAMAFWQFNQSKLGSNIALVSIGGTFSDNQILGIIDRFPNARLVDCFDNDIAGRVNGLRLLAVAENKKITIKTDNNIIQVDFKDKHFEINPEKALYPQVASYVSVQSKMGSVLPPKDFKDWNDCILGKSVSVSVQPTKHDRNNNLAEIRRSSFKR